MDKKYYKAFTHDMKCRDKQYEENKVYEESGSDICEAGVMHFCENPFDVLNYYPLVDEEGKLNHILMFMVVSHMQVVVNIQLKVIYGGLDLIVATMVMLKIGNVCMSIFQI